MKRFPLYLVVSLIAMFAIGACGVQDPEDSGSTDTPCVDCDTPDPDPDPEPCEDCEEPVELVAGPFRSPAACVLDFNSAYVSGATCGEVRGNLPGITWESGARILDDDLDGWMGMAYELPAGEYDLSYLGFQDCDSASPNEAWAQMGHVLQLLQMLAADRAFVFCNWWDASAEEMLEVESPSCWIRIVVDGECNITAGGNMGNFGTDGQ
ncbi:hypothetical protein AMJ57_01760 [Parcubacteria bacterium SG8_24]|nr:MAG: hypothetical protein AMJ57_01760 [Parcubacteria bacterium SG8_24]